MSTTLLIKAEDVDFDQTSSALELPKSPDNKALRDVENVRFIKAELPKWYDNAKSNTKKFVNTQQLSKDYIKYYKIFREGYQKNKDLFSSFSFNFVSDVFETIIRNILTSGPDRISLGFTNDVSIFIKSVLYNKNLYTEIFFDKEIDNDVEVVINLYTNKECTYSYSGDIENSIQEIMQHFPNYNVASYTFQNTLSEASYSENLI